MNVTQTLLAFIIAVAVVSGLNIFTGDVLGNYNSTTSNTSLGMAKYNTGYVSWVSAMSDSTKATVQKTPEGILGQIVTGIFWVLDSIKNFLGIIPAIGNTMTDLSGQASASGMVKIPDFTFPLIAIMITVSFMGYFLYLLIGKSGDNSGYV